MKILEHLLKNVTVISYDGPLDRQVSFITADSRKCRKDSLFVARRGTKTDGAEFIDNAVRSGARTIVIEPGNEIPKVENVTVVVVENAEIALAAMAHALHDYPTQGLRVIGVTGTNGKTTSTFLLKSLFEAAGERVGLIGTTGIYIGEVMLPATHTTPEAVELAELFSSMRKRGIKTVIMEVSSHALAQHRVDFIEFAAAIFTNLTHDHLDYHETMENYAAAKKKLFQMLLPRGIAVVFDDDKYGRYMLEDIPTAQKYCVGRTENADVQINNEKLQLSSTEFSLSFSNTLPLWLRGDMNISMPIIGRFNIDNAALCAACCRIMGMDEKTIVQGLATAYGAPGRMHRILLKSGAVAIVDYAHSPDALEKALKSCREVLDHDAEVQGHIICVFGCGGDRDQQKRPIMGAIAAELADRIVVTNDNPRTESPQKIIQEIMAGIPSENRVKVTPLPDRAQAIHYAVKIANANDIILIAGKGHEMYQIIGNEKIHFSDVEELVHSGAVARLENDLSH
ncbi:MAG TPA: UDP-N-acetylmuramoyl-L-alanyl-D-glutamate--2,6-diaminopimelate ligase [Patescibacteria group bacterium]|nr:UDP-N-acetylmuramoyl-L-alanyl-D-glutamate--2,6-diaminopimelate ligase [Patescibacteria group bacterium]